ncbi:MAG: hypothetical protein Q8Q26_09230 [Pseudorhodobacter sp.]|nr:hypothetical protein [Pseudorhodobacter sp.]
MTCAAIACLAGRRIDEVDADTPRFPLHRADAVGEAIAAVLAERKIVRLVCAAACGADILALEACEAQAIPATIILPFSVAVFREVSVIDRPGDWGPRFDHVIARARAHSDLIELGYAETDQHAFDKANREIVARVSALGADEHLAILVWNGVARGEKDATADLADRARAAGFQIVEVSTMGQLPCLG